MGDGDVDGLSIAVWLVMPFHTVLVIWEIKLGFLEAADMSWFLLSASFPASPGFSLEGGRWFENSFHIFSLKRSPRLGLACRAIDSLLRR